MARKNKGEIVDPRPDWDTYFMQIAGVVSTRSNCSRRQVAAVIVKDNHILSTGYNGTPHGTKNCFAGGCPRCAGKTPSGSHLEECLCVHAEQNAICAAARHGVNISGARIYVTISPLFFLAIWPTPLLRRRSSPRALCGRRRAPCPRSPREDSDVQAQ